MRVTVPLGLVMGAVVTTTAEVITTVINERLSLKLILKTAAHP